jgi:hypothetical protein
MSIPPYGAAIASLIAKGFAAGRQSGFGQSVASTVTKQSLDNIINQGAIERSKNNVLTIASNRLNAFSTGQLTPKDEWEVSGAYLAKTGQPFFVSIGSKGLPEITRMRDSDLSKYNLTQQNKLTTALDQLDQLVIKQNANQTNQGMRMQLENAAKQLSRQQNGLDQATDDFFIKAKNLTTNLVPFKLGLDSSGKLVLGDQTKATFMDERADRRTVLQQAVSDWNDAVTSEIYIQPWQNEAKTLADLGKSFYFDVDNLGAVQVKENTVENVVPQFLKEDPYPNLGASTKWQKDALAFAAAGTPFFLDIDGATQSVVAKQVTPQNLISFAKPPFYQQQAGAIVSLLG